MHIALMGFFTMVTFSFLCSSIFAVVLASAIISFFSFFEKKLSQKKIKLVFFSIAFSYFFFSEVAFNYSDFFLYYFIGKTKTPFFIADANLLAFHLFKNVIFFSWVFYFPFFCYVILLLIKPAQIGAEYQRLARLIFYVVYLHFLSIAITHFDVFHFFQDFFDSSLGSWFERIDYSSHLIFYRGTFFDIWFAFIFFWFFYLFIVDYTCRVSVRRYSIFQYFQVNEISYFWGVFYFYWAFRRFISVCILYFFTGEGAFSDLIIIFFTYAFSEVLVAFIRIAFSLNAWKLLYILLSFRIIFLLLIKNRSLTIITFFYNSVFKRKRNKFHMC